MADKIYVRRGDELEPMVEQRFESEDKLQELLAGHMELLDGDQMTPGNPRRWILITREKDIETPDGAYWWSLDHLLIDQDSIPTLVEVKRGDNSEVRRKVVGQMLDYAAHAEYWTADELRETFQKTNEDPDAALRELLLEQGTQVLGESEDDDWEDRKAVFWEDVGTNLRAKRLRLLFVADAIPETLARVVAFLNEQMPRIEVLAVEIKQFKGESSQTLVPRVSGHTAQLPGNARGGARGRSSISIDEFMRQLPDNGVRPAAERLIEVATNRGGKVVRNDKSLTLRVDVPKEFSNPPITVAWLYPVPDIAFWSGTKNFSFGSANYPNGANRCAQPWITGFSNLPTMISVRTPLTETSGCVCLPTSR